MLLSHRLEKNISIKYDEFQFDEDYLKSNYINDKIIDIQWNNKDFVKLIQELKKYISNVSTKINQYLTHIDYDSLEYIKDIQTLLTCTDFNFKIPHTKYHISGGG